MILLIDNYDSFTYNLYQYIGEVNSDIEVYRNDKITVPEIRDKKPSHIVISPGPGFPRDAGVCIEIIKTLGNTIPILGVCLGHQAIGEAYGGVVVRANELMHGKASEILIDTECSIFDSLPERIVAGRYHSLIVDKETLPKELKVIAKTQSGEVMGLKHIEYSVYGIQFHPESILTHDGKKMLANFLKDKSKRRNINA